MLLGYKALLKANLYFLFMLQTASLLNHTCNELVKMLTEELVSNLSKVRAIYSLIASLGEIKSSSNLSSHIGKLCVDGTFYLASCCYVIVALKLKQIYFSLN